MAGSAQIIGHGSKLELDAAVTTTNGILSIDFGSNKVDTHDNTDMGTTGTARTFVGGLENSGDISAKFNIIPGDASQATLRAAKDGQIHTFKAIYPGAVRTRTFSGIITSYDEAIPDDKLPTFTIKIQITGPITDS